MGYPRTHVMVPMAISHSHSQHTVYGNYSGGICRRKKSQTINYSVVICLGWPLKWQKLMKWPANKSGTNIYDEETVNGYVVWPTYGGFIYSSSTCECVNRILIGSMRAYNRRHSIFYAITLCFDTNARHIVSVIVDLAENEPHRINHGQVENSFTPTTVYTGVDFLCVCTACTAH